MRMMNPPISAQRASTFFYNEDDNPTNECTERLSDDVTFLEFKLLKFLKHLLRVDDDEVNDADEDHDIDDHHVDNHVDTSLSLSEA